jgi:protease II
VRDSPDTDSLSTLWSECCADRELFFIFVSFAYPGETYRYDFDTQALSVFRQTEIAGFSPADYETEQVLWRERKRDSEV